MNSKGSSCGWLSDASSLPEDAWVWLAKILGALAGSAISIVYVLPKGRREAASRFVVGVIAGLIFGTSVGHHMAAKLEINEALSSWEITLAGATLSSLAAWWLIGLLIRLAERYPK